MSKSFVDFCCPLWANLVRNESWCCFGCHCWGFPVPLGAFGSLLGLFWAPLGILWAPLDAFRCLFISLGSLWWSVWCLWESSGTIWAAFGELWPVFGHSYVYLCCSGLTLWVLGFKFGFRDCTFDLSHVQSLYLSLFLLTLSHMGSTCCRLQLYSSVCYECDSWFDTWRHNFIVGNEVTKLNVFIPVWTWRSRLQLDLLHLLYFIWACPPSCYLTWVALVLDCN